MHVQCTQLIRCHCVFLCSPPPHTLPLSPAPTAMSKVKATKEEEALTRIAIVNADKCKPRKCRQECKRSCPVVRMGKMCIEVEVTSKVAFISEILCIGCGICVKKVRNTHDTVGPRMRLCVLV